MGRFLPFNGKAILVTKIFCDLSIFHFAFSINSLKGTLFYFPNFIIRSRLRLQYTPFEA